MSGNRTFDIDSMSCSSELNSAPGLLLPLLRLCLAKNNRKESVEGKPGFKNLIFFELSFLCFACVNRNEMGLSALIDMR